ncbi:aldo/keto reductase [bacterium]|nr:aldo/keto reductase [bacterium]
MEYRNYGRTGIKVTPLCLGCMMFGGRTTKEDSADIIDRALNGGLNFLDTANAYSRGLSEEAVGAALARNGKRDRIILATKVFAPMDKEDPNMQGNSRRHIIQQCDASLKRLQTDYIDIYQIHRPMPEIAIDETLRALDDLVRAGKVRYIGTSTFASWQIMEGLWASKELGLNRFVSEQPPYNLLDRSIERELIPMAQTYGLALIPWSPLAGGFLTGKYRRGQEPPEGARLKKNPRTDKVLVDSAFDVLEGAEAIAKDKGCSVSQLALAWCAQQPGITSAIIGPRTMEQLEDNLKALDVDITEEDRKRIDEVIAPGESVSLYYTANWGPHPHRVL